MVSVMIIGELIRQTKMKGHKITSMKHKGIIKNIEIKQDHIRIGVSCWTWLLPNTLSFDLDKALEPHAVKAYNENKPVTLSVTWYDYVVIIWWYFTNTDGKSKYRIDGDVIIE